MSVKAEVSRVIWHDLMTQNVPKASHFYADLFGWNYQIEHASNFVWKPGKADYVLIFADGEAHGGFVALGQSPLSGWIAYVMVKDVDATAALAQGLGATIVRAAFDTPGVGRSAVIQDLQGAVICPNFPIHHFPAPSGTFLWDELITDDVESAKLFYGQLFGWRSYDINVTRNNSYAVLQSPDNAAVVGITNQFFDAVRLAVWVPYFATDDIDVTIANAKTLGANVCVEETYMPNGKRKAILVDPTGALFGLLTSSEFRINELSTKM